MRNYLLMQRVTVSPGTDEGWLLSLGPDDVETLIKLLFSKVLFFVDSAIITT